MIGSTFEVPAVLSEGRHWAKRQILLAMHRYAEDHNVVLSPIRYETGVDQQYGPVLIGTSEVVAMRPPTSRLTDDLDRPSLLRLRAATRKQSNRVLSDQECDIMINQIAPSTAAKLLH